MPKRVLWPHLPLRTLAKCTNEQLDSFDDRGRALRCLNITNPSPGKGRVVGNIWHQVGAIHGVYKARGMRQPTIKL